MCNALHEKKKTWYRKKKKCGKSYYDLYKIYTNKNANKHYLEYADMLHEQGIHVQVEFEENSYTMLVLIYGSLTMVRKLS